MSEPLKKSKTRDELLAQNLPKWPGLAVLGERVTLDQAAEIIVRTDGFSFDSNDVVWDRMCREAAGLPPPWSDQLHAEQRSGVKTDLRLALAQEDTVRRRYGVLDELEYLHNACVTSSWIGGPHGWCNWNGSIFSNNSNIGKWPNTESVLREWEIIARAFPFLKLRSQLFSGETGEAHSVPVIEYVVACGSVDVVEPSGELLPLTSPDLSRLMLMAMGGNAHGERGCTLDQFKAALAIAERATGGQHV